MASKTDTTRYALIAAACVVAVILGGSLSMLIFGDRGKGFGENLSSQMGEALIGGPFSLVDHHGNPVDESMLKGKITLMYFGYTFCPDFCPAGLQEMAAALDGLKEAGIDAQGVFVSVDPERDTVDVMAEYVPLFHPDIIGLTGTLEQTDATAKKWRAVYGFVEDESFTDGYSVEHTTLMYAMGTDGRFLMHFTHGETGAEIAAKLLRRLGNS
ncbi:MAG: SCO family protein [Neomegalonema sp.]|nr:SCO family protein [Neomegalonema sp.]